MRKAFVNTLVELAAKDERVLLLTGDLGYTVLEPFIEKFPDRFFNVGVAEQNMIGIATGLAESGFIPFVYSIATFALLRPYEFIRNGPVLHKLAVRIIGLGGGFEYGPAGITHHALEDLGVTRLQPGMAVIAPSDFQQARSALLASWNLPGPVYYRLGKDEKTVIPGLQGKFELGKPQVIREGTDLVILTCGGIACEAYAATEILASKGISTEVVLVSTLSPAPIKDLAGILENFPLALTVEAHYTTGGIGSLVSEIIAEKNIPCRLVRCGVDSTKNVATGSQAYLHKKYNLSADALAKQVIQNLRMRRVNR
ncbi:MAG: transketolase C-terminal domain-containing protein [Candidatus Omnitrophica bacterium]|nr:transketolase C-terminal domain-containing protein [Candidatus Omnitrophota bacterium]MDD5652697.1 transketolase C-terminal domain-containing protein [Candidatus Omnitrophota bacterium]